MDITKSILMNIGRTRGDKTFRQLIEKHESSDGRTAFLLKLLLESRILEKMQEDGALSEQKAFAYAARLENEYGISPSYSVPAMRVLAKAYHITVAPFFLPEELEALSTPIVHKLQELPAPVKTETSDYRYTAHNGYIIIYRYVAIDQTVVTIPHQLDGLPVREISSETFRNCSSIEKVVIPDGVVEIGWGAFADCTKLREVILPRTLQKLGITPYTTSRSNMRKYVHYSGVFENTAIERISLPSGLLEIGAHAFESCKKLKFIDLPNGIKSLPDGCFARCEALTSVILPDDLEYIGENAFCHSAFSSIFIPESVRVVDSCAFFGCTKLESVYLNEGLSTIGSSAFSNCTGLKWVQFPRSLKSIHEKAFSKDDYYTLRITAYCYAGTYGLDYAQQQKLQIKDAEKESPVHAIPDQQIEKHTQNNEAAEEQAKRLKTPWNYY